MLQNLSSAAVMIGALRVKQRINEPEHKILVLITYAQMPQKLIYSSMSSVNASSDGTGHLPKPSLLTDVIITLH